MQVKVDGVPESRTFCTGAEDNCADDVFPFWGWHVMRLLTDGLHQRGGANRPRENRDGGAALASIPSAVESFMKIIADVG